MGCIPSSTYPEHIPRHTSTAAAAATAASVQGGSDFVFSRQMSIALGPSGSPHANTNTNSGTFKQSASGSHPRSSPHHSPADGPPLRLRSQVDVGLPPTTYTTSSGKKYKFLYGRPLGFAAAEEVLPCLDDVGMCGNLYRLVRSKLLSIGEEEANDNDDDDGAGGDGHHHADTLSQSEAREREQGMEQLACSVTARRRPQDTSREAALQEQFVVALLGTDTILDTSAIAPSRRRPRRTAAPTSLENQRNDPHDTLDASHLSATQPLPLPLPPSDQGLPSSSNDTKDNHPQPTSAKADGAAASPSNPLDFDFEEEQDYQLFPQQHYSALPAQRRAGGAVPVAFCPPSRTLRVPVKYSAVEDRVVAVQGKAGDKGKSWKEKVMPQRMFRLATSETRTWAFYNDSEYVMHVYTLFDRSSKLEPRDSTRLWPSSVFDDGNDAPTPPPVFFGIFFDEDGEEAVPASEVPDSVARRPQRVFGTHGMWVAELLVPPRSTRLFVEGKIRGAYRMRCTRLDLDDLVTVTATALAVARRRNAKTATDRFHFSRHRPGRNSASVVERDRRSGAAPTATIITTAVTAATTAVSPPPTLDQHSLLTPSLPSDAPLTSSETVARTPHPLRSATLSPTLGSNKNRSSTSLRAGETAVGTAATVVVPSTDKTALEVGCHSTLTESQGILTRQTYIHHGTAADTATATAPNPLAAPEKGMEVAPESLPRVAPPPPPPPLPSSSGFTPVREVASPSSSGNGGLRALPDATTVLAATVSNHPAVALAATPASPVHRPRHDEASGTESRAASVSETAPHATEAHLRGDTPANAHTSRIVPAEGDATTNTPHNGLLHSSSGAAAVPGPQSALSFPSVPSSDVKRECNGDDDDDDGEDGEDEEDGAQGSCAEFARVRPDRQRPASDREEALLSGSSPHTPRKNASDNASAGLPLLQAGLPHFAKATSASAAGYDNDDAGSGGGGLQSGTQPRRRRSRLSNVPSTTGLGVAHDVAERCKSPESAGTLNGVSWRPKVHTLSPQSSYQSGHLRRTGAPSVSSCRTVAVDVSTGSLDVEGGIQEDQTTAADTNDGNPFTRAASNAVSP